MKRGNIIIQEALTVIQYAGHFIPYFTYFMPSKQSSAQCLHSLRFRGRFYHVLNVLFYSSKFLTP